MVNAVGSEAYLAGMGIERSVDRAPEREPGRFQFSEGAERAIGAFEFSHTLRDAADTLDPQGADRFHDLADILDGFGDLGGGDAAPEDIDAAADSLGDLVNDIDDPVLAADLNELESELRDALADGDLSPERIDEIADAIGEAVNDIDDPALAAKLNEVEQSLRDAIPEETYLSKRLDKMADRLGEMANDADDPEQAAALNAAEQSIRDAMADGNVSPEEMDDIADAMGEAVNDLDGDTATEFNGMESDMRNMLANMKSDRRETLDEVADQLGTLANRIQDPDLAAEVNALEGRIRDALASGDFSRETMREIATDLRALADESGAEVDRFTRSDSDTDFREMLRGGVGDNFADIMRMPAAIQAGFI